MGLGLFPSVDSSSLSVFGWFPSVDSFSLFSFCQDFRLILFLLGFVAVDFSFCRDFVTGDSFFITIFFRIVLGNSPFGFSFCQDFVSDDSILLLNSLSVKILLRAILFLSQAFIFLFCYVLFTCDGKSMRWIYLSMPFLDVFLITTNGLLTHSPCYHTNFYR